jgi:predicted HD phosphohydrolase
MDTSRILDLVEDLGDTPYGLEAVDQRAHALQTASLALADGASDVLVVAALLHDIARHPRVRRGFPGLPHEQAGSLWTVPILGNEVAWLVGAHVPAKRYLVARDPAYADTLSKESVVTLRGQGGAMSAKEAALFEANALALDGVRLRRWDDAAKVVGGHEANRAELRAVLDRLRPPRAE